MWFRKREFEPFRYPDGQWVREGDAVLWGAGGFYPGRIEGFIRQAGTLAGHADAVEIDAGAGARHRMEAQGFNPDDLRFVARATRDFKGDCLRHLAARIEAGNAHSMYVLGCLVDQGRFMAPDPVRASALLERAAQLGHPMAMVEIALLLERGVPAGQPDMLRAIRWMQQADAAGIPSARRWLAARGM